MKEYFSIGEVAQLFHMNVRTLRYYDEIGLLHPGRIEEATGYRYYTTTEFERLNTIKYLRALDMPLKKIGIFFENRNVDVLQTLLEEQRAQTADKIRSLQRIEKKLMNSLNTLEEAVRPWSEDIRLVYLEKRQIAYLRKEIPMGDNLEYPIRELEEANMLEPIMFLGKVGVSISVQNMRQGCFDHFSGIFVMLEQEDKYQGEQRYLPAGNYACVRFQGTHKEAAPHYQRVICYIDKQNYGIAGDSVEVTLIDGGFTNDTSRYLTEIQVPICKKEMDTL